MGKMMLFFIYCDLLYRGALEGCIVSETTQFHSLLKTNTSKQWSWGKQTKSVLHPHSSTMICLFV